LKLVFQLLLGYAFTRGIQMHLRLIIIASWRNFFNKTKTRKCILTWWRFEEYVCMINYKNWVPYFDNQPALDVKIYRIQKILAEILINSGGINQSFYTRILHRFLILQSFANQHHMTCELLVIINLTSCMKNILSKKL
jgi:hypothetical protein